MTGYLTLRKLAERSPVLEIGCVKCHRIERLDVEALIATHGPGKSLVDLLGEVTQGCSKRIKNDYNDQCGARYSRMMELFGAGNRWDNKAGKDPEEKSDVRAVQVSERNRKAGVDVRHEVSEKL